jgi:dienelactone hydrolase
MAELLLFHHAQGLTGGCRSFAARLEAAGHVVHAPDLYDGAVFADLAGGIAHAERLGFASLLERGRRAADGLPDALVYVGLSLGAMPAQLLAQTRPGARGAVLLHACVEPSELGSPWPRDVPLQVHMMDADPLVLPPNPDLAVARELARTFDGAALFEYPGDRHLFADDSSPDHDEDAAALLGQRVLAFLSDLDGRAAPAGDDEELARRLRGLLAGEADVTERRMFGGLAFMARGHMAVAASGKGGLMVRVEPEETDALLARTGVREVEMRGRALDGWVRVDAEAVATEGELAAWVQRGVAYARGLPPKA